MRAFFVCAIVLLFGGSSAAAGCAQDILTFDTWEIDPIDDDTNRLTTNFTFVGDKPIRMLDASAGFEDVLGERIASFAMEKDLTLSKGDAHQEIGRWGRNTFERLLDMNPDDVVTKLCVRAVVYQDGTVEKF